MPLTIDRRRLNVPTKKVPIAILIFLLAMEYRTTEVADQIITRQGEGCTIVEEWK